MAMNMDRKRGRSNGRGVAKRIGRKLVHKLTERRKVRALIVLLCQQFLNSSFGLSEYRPLNLVSVIFGYSEIKSCRGASMLKRYASPVEAIYAALGDD